MATFQDLEAEIIRLREALAKQNDEICQTLGKALGYPWYKDDQQNFPGATEENGVCVGEHVAESLAMEAARKIEQLGGLAVVLSEAADVGVAYLSFVNESGHGTAARQTELAGSGLILDWNKDHQLIGIEFLNTSRLPPREGRSDGARDDA